MTSDTEPAPLESPAAIEATSRAEGDAGLVDPGSGFAGASGQVTALGGIRRQTQFGDVRRRFKRNKLAVLGLVMIASVVLMALLAPWIAPQNPLHQDLLNTQASPGRAHWIGTDEVGRDQLSRLIHGSRIAVIVGVASIGIALVIGIALGALAGYFGRWWDTIIMRVADVFFAFPVIIGAIVIILVIGRGIMPVILSIGIFSWATVARLLRSSILSIRESEYVEAARSLGASRWRIVTRHILPNSLAPVLVYATVAVATAIVAEAALSFLGAGVKPGTPDWGAMISDGQKFFGYKDFLWFFPSIAVVYTVLGFVFVGDGLRDALDPKLR
ncbi:MAG: ABC transporter permease [Actinomycetota bacterium]